MTARGHSFKFAVQICCALLCTRSTSDLPNFFASTKFFACLDLLESQELFEATQMVRSCLPAATRPV